MNQNKLRDLKVPEHDIKAFMRNKSFPLSVQTAFVENLTHLSGIRGFLAIVTLADTAESEDQARFLADALEMPVRYHQTQTPLVEIIARGTIVGRDRAGVVIVPAEVDYVTWTQRLANFASRTDLTAQKRGVWLSGKMSPRAKENFEALGWVVAERTTL
jgi:hypothetical protein